MLTPLPIAEKLLVVAAGLLVMAVATGVAFYVVHALVAVFFAGQLVAKAAEA